MKASTTQHIAARVRTRRVTRWTVADVRHPAFLIAEPCSYIRRVPLNLRVDV